MHFLFSYSQYSLWYLLRSNYNCGPLPSSSDWTVSRDIERSRHFAKTLRQTGEQRLWTAKYDNAPR